MSDEIKMIIIGVAVVAFGVWCFFAGLYAWKYPRLRFEFGDDHEKMRFQIYKILIGICAVIGGIGVIIDAIIQIFR